MVTTDKVTVAEFSPHIVKTTTDYKENDMGVKTERKDQATLIANLISRVTSLEEDMEFAFKHIKILEDDMLVTVASPSWEKGIKNYKMPDDRIVVFEFDENGVGKITVEAMDELMEMIGAKEIDG